MTGALQTDMSDSYQQGFFHGDREDVDGLIDVAVNVNDDGPPAFLADALANPKLALRYPNAGRATAVVAESHHVSVDQVLCLNGSSEGFSLIAQALLPPGEKSALVIHPQFSGPDEALVSRRICTHHHILDPAQGFVLNPDEVPDFGDVVFIGNPTNPTSVLHRRDDIASLRMRRDGRRRIVVVDEVFLDAVPGEPESMIGSQMDGVIVLRSLTKTFGIPGIRAGYAVGDPALIAKMSQLQQLWSVSGQALRALELCRGAQGVEFSARRARQLSAWKREFVAWLREEGIEVAGSPQAPFVLVHVEDRWTTPEPCLPARQSLDEQFLLRE